MEWGRESYTPTRVFNALGRVQRLHMSISTTQHDKVSIIEKSPLKAILKQTSFLT
jgi:hypothetical protein